MEDRLNSNQNLWVLFISYAALGGAEYWRIQFLCWLSLVVSVAATISVLFTTFFYTRAYCKKKNAE